MGLPRIGQQGHKSVPAGAHSKSEPQIAIIAGPARVDCKALHQGGCSGLPLGGSTPPQSSNSASGLALCLDAGLARLQLARPSGHGLGVAAHVDDPRRCPPPRRERHPFARLAKQVLHIYIKGAQVWAGPMRQPSRPHHMRGPWRRTVVLGELQRLPTMRPQAGLARLLRRVVSVARLRPARC